MNVERLRQAELEFMIRYPGGFENEEMQEIAKRHRIDKISAKAKDLFAPDRFLFPEEIVASMTSLITKSSMVSIFEKPKFRDFVKLLRKDEKELLAKGLYEFLHGNQGFGFDLMVDVLSIGQMAKWTILTICPVYYAPDKEIFIKPTTTKFAISYFELEGLHYQPRPDYRFYAEYKKQLTEMKSRVSPLLSPNNPAFTGFLMNSMPKYRDLP